jgi:hypothetical protein
MQPEVMKWPWLDGDGFPVQTRGMTRHPGLWFVGIPWMPSRKTGTFLGTGDLPTPTWPGSRWRSAAYSFASDEARAVRRLTSDGGTSRDDTGTVAERLADVIVCFATASISQSLCSRVLWDRAIRGRWIDTGRGARKAIGSRLALTVGFGRRFARGES